MDKREVAGGLEACLGMSSSIMMLSDPTGDFSEAAGLIGYLGKDLGIRSKRYGVPRLAAPWSPAPFPRVPLRINKADDVDITPLACAQPWSSRTDVVPILLSIRDLIILRPPPLRR